MTTDGLAAVRAAATGSVSPAATAAALAAAAAAASSPAKPEAPDNSAAVAAARAEGVTEGTKAGAATERARIKAIVGAPEAKGREALAQSLAFDTDLSPEAAVQVMKAAPEAKGSRLDGIVPQPKVDTSEAGKQPSAAASWDALVSEQNKSLGGRAAKH
jgi:hypothetical protein